MLELGEGAAALPVGVWRGLGFGGVGAVALVHGGSGLGQAAGRSYFEDRAALWGTRGEGARKYLGIRGQRF